MMYALKILESELKNQCGGFDWCYVYLKQHSELMWARRQYVDAQIPCTCSELMYTTPHWHLGNSASYMQFGERAVGVEWWRWRPVSSTSRKDQPVRDCTGSRFTTFISIRAAGTDHAFMKCTMFPASTALYEHYPEITNARG